MKNISVFIILLTSIVLSANTKYITYIENSSGGEFNIFMNQRSIQVLKEANNGLVFGGCASGSTGKAILFCYDPIKEYSNPGYSAEDNPKIIFSKIDQSQYSDYYNVLGIALTYKNENPDTIYFAIQGTNEPNSSTPYKLLKIDYKNIFDTISPYEVIDLGTSPNTLTYITAFSYNDTYIAIAGDKGSGGKIEFFNVKTNSFINTAVDIMQSTGNRDYRVVSLTTDGKNFYAGTLTINDTAEVLKIDQNFHVSVLFSPDISYFDNDSTSPLITMISALYVYKNKIYMGTESTSTKYGGMVFYYDLNSDTSTLLGKAVKNTHTFGIMAFTEYNGEIYGSTKGDYDRNNINDKNSWGRIFKISKNDSIVETTLIDYRGEYPDYNPAIIPSICPSHKTNDVIFGTQGTYTTDWVNYGGLMGKTDFYPPSPPKILRVYKSDKKINIDLFSGDDFYNIGKASYYEIKGSMDRIYTPLEYISLKTLKFSESPHIEFDKIYYPYLYIKAYDNVMNPSEMIVLKNNFYESKIFPNPVKKGEILTILMPATLKWIKCYSIDGNEITLPFTLKEIDDNGYKVITVDTSDLNISSGVYIITGKTYENRSYYLKFAFIK